MTKTKFEREVSRIVSLKWRLDKTFSSLEDALGGVTEGDLHEAAYGSLELAIEHLCTLSGDVKCWLNWYLYEGGGSCKINGAEMPCGNSGELWEIIKAHNEEAA